MKKLLTLALTFGAPFNANATQWCEQNVDKLQLFYVNGIYTTASSFFENLKSLEKVPRRIS